MSFLDVKELYAMLSVTKEGIVKSIVARLPFSMSCQENKPTQAVENL